MEFDMVNKYVVFLNINYETSENEKSEFVFCA